MIQRLIELGLSNYEATAYFALLRQGAATSTEVAHFASIPNQRVQDVLASLASKGFCSTRNTTPRVFIASEPRAAFQQLSQLQEEAFRQQAFQRSLEAEKLMDHLQPLFEQAKQNIELPGVELVNDQSHAIGRFRELLRACADSVCFTVKIGSHSGAIFDPEKLQEAIRAKGLSCRAIVENPALGDPTLQQLLNDLAKVGATIRTIDHLPVQLSVFDSTHSMLSVPEESVPDHASTSLVIRHVPTAEFIRFGFNKMWAEGSSLTPR